MTERDYFESFSGDLTSDERLRLRDQGQLYEMLAIVESIIADRQRGIENTGLSVAELYADFDPSGFAFKVDTP